MTVTIDRSAPAITSALRTGVVLVERTLLASYNATAKARAYAILADSCQTASQFVMGWGNPNPWPTSTMTAATMDWSGMDARMDIMETAGLEPHMSLMLVPDWMKGGTDGTTTWSPRSWIEKRVLPEHVSDYIELVRRVAARYKGRVARYLMYPEMKGYYGGDYNGWQWEYELLTDLYNLVYPAVKTEDPDALVGGLYIPTIANRMGPLPPSDDRYLLLGNGDQVDRRPLESQLYFDANCVGVDFYACDGGYPGGNLYPDDVAAWFRAKMSRDLPLQYGEYYAGTPPETRNLNVQVGQAQLAANFIRGAYGGVETFNTWAPEIGAGFDDQALWTSTQTSSGGQRLPSADTHKAFKDHFPPGTDLYTVTSSDANVTAIASNAHVFVVNNQATAKTVDVDGTTVSLAPYEFRTLAITAPAGGGGGIGASNGYLDAITAWGATGSTWRLNEPVGSTTVGDSLGAVTGTASGGVTFGAPSLVPAAPDDTSTTFDGTGKVTLGDVYDMTGVSTWTMLATVKPTTVDGTQRIFAGKSYFTTVADRGGTFAAINTAAGFRYARTGPNTIQDGHTAGGVASAGTVEHTGATYDGTSIRVYHNGQPAGTYASDVAVPDNALDFTLGMAADDDAPFIGSLAYAVVLPDFVATDQQMADAHTAWATVPPSGTVAISAPASVDTTFTATATVTGDVGQVTFTFRSIDTSTDTTAADGFSADFDATALPNGDYALTAEGYTADGLTLLDTETITVAVAHPLSGTITVTAPADGATADESVTATVTVTGDVSIVRFTLGTQEPVVVTAAPYTVELSTGDLEDGDYTLLVEGVAADNSVLDSESLTITVEHPRLALLAGALHVGLGLGL